MINGFVVEIDNKLYSENTGFRLVSSEERQNTDSSSVLEEIYSDEDNHFLVKSMTEMYKGFPIRKRSISLTNQRDKEITVTRIDSIHGILPKGEYTLNHFYCPGGGLEFEPRVSNLKESTILESTSGRSSRGSHPWFTLQNKDGSILAGAVAWSGNWIVRFEPKADEAHEISGGLHNWEFSKIIKPGETMESIEVIYAFLPEGDVDDVSIAFGSWGKQHWYPQNQISRNVPVAWNHWWPYEDSGINEDIFKANVDECAKLGIEICVLDAGWFGEPDEHCNDHRGWSEDVDWYLKRGDWHKVNTTRFPSGIAALSEYVHSKGLKFGIWCEIEALGPKADLNTLHSEFRALRDDEPLGYVCLGNPEAREWAFGVLEHLIVDYKADWLKLDFNLDPKAGCNRTDHGHGKGDGLYEHYRGYYELLTRIREKYPEVYLENCSSGGLRMDLGLAKHTHGAFLSDPDHTRHHLQVFWAASQMLHPSVCYHFTWSQTIVHYDSNLVQDPIQPDMSPEKFDYMIRANMLNAFGCSYRLPDLPDWAKTRLAEHIDFYKNTVRSFITNSDMYRLTGQTHRDGGGDSWNEYSFVKKDKGEALVFIFCFKEAELERKFLLKGLDPERLRFNDLDLINKEVHKSSLKKEGSEIIYVNK